MGSAGSGLSLSQLLVSRRYAWAVNRLAIAATCAAVFTSAAVEALEESKSLYIAGGFAMAWPLSLLGADVILTRVPDIGSVSSFRIRRLGAAIIAVCAFAGSAEHSVSLAVWLGVPWATAWTAPVILDGLIIISGQSLVDLAEEIFKARQSNAAPTEPIDVDLNKEQSSVEHVAVPTLDEPSDPSKLAAIERSKPSGKRRTALSENVAVALEGDPTLTAKALAGRFGVSSKTISRTDAWKTRKEVSEVAS